MLVHHITKFCIGTDRLQTSGIRIFSSVMTDCSNTECGAVRTCPDNIRLSKKSYDILCGYLINVLIQINVLKVLGPLHTEYFMPSTLKGFPDTPCSCK